MDGLDADTSLKSHITCWLYPVTVVKTQQGDMMDPQVTATF